MSKQIGMDGANTLGWMEYLLSVQIHGSCCETSMNQLNGDENVTILRILRWIPRGVVLITRRTIKFESIRLEP